jgi:hypothetical protein
MLLCFLNVWSAKCLNWSIVTRAHAPRQPDAECSMPCEGNPQQKCGASWRNSVYEVEGRGVTLQTELLAHYCFDEIVTSEGASTQKASAADCSPNGRDGTVIGGVTFVVGGGYNRGTGSGYNGYAAAFDGTGSITVNAFENFDWGSALSISIWFNRGCTTSACDGVAPDGVTPEPYCDGLYSGVIGNGYYDSGSWEVRMGREDACSMLGGGVITPAHPIAWDHVGLNAELGAWHHVAMIYDGDGALFRAARRGLERCRAAAPRPERL